MNKIVAALLVGALLLAGCASGAGMSAMTPMPPGAEAISLLGDTLRAAALPDSTRRVFEARRDAAARAVAADPDDPDALVWLGRRTAYLGRYREAITVFTRGIERFPRDARFYRHRGHRWITVRDFERAAADLERAAGLVRGTPDQVEPDGLPNARGIPTSTLQSNIYYHLGLAYYLRRDYRRAVGAYDEGMLVSTNPDMDIATRYWKYLTLRRLRRDEEAARLLEPVTRDLAIIENAGYHRLLMVFTRMMPIDSVQTAGEGVDGATTWYGLSAWLAAEGRAGEAMTWLQRARSGTQWAAFGFIAAEADLRR